MELTEYHDDERKRMIVYGDPFTGKTTLVAKLAEKFKLKWIDIEHGASSIIRNVPKQFHKNIDLIQIPDSKVNPMAAETVLKIFKAPHMEAVICATHGKISCPLCAKVPEAKFSSICLNKLGADEIVVLDSATQLTNSIISHITRNQKDDYKMDFDDWGTLAKLLDIIFTQIQGGHYNCVIISHAAMVGTEKSEKITKLVPIGGSSNYSRTFAKFFDDIVYCEVLNGKHKFTSRTGASPQVITGSKSNVDIETMAEPSLIPFFS